MSDQLDGKGVRFPGAGQHQEASPEGGGESGTSQPDYLTRAEAEQLAKDAAEDAAEDAFRRAQSLYDKGQDKVRAKLAEVESYVNRSKSIGVELTDDQIKTMRQQAMTEAWTEQQQGTDPENPPQQQPAQAAAGGQDDELDPINAEAIRIMQDTGVELLDGDPEVEKYLANVNQMTPFEYLQAVQQAAAEKLERNQRTPQSRISGLGAGGAAGGDLQAQYEAEIKKAGRGNVQAIAAIKHKYRQKGLDVW